MRSHYAWCQKNYIHNSTNFLPFIHNLNYYINVHLWFKTTSKIILGLEAKKRPSTWRLKFQIQNANFSYFGCVKRPVGKDFSRGKKFGIERLKHCAQNDKVMALMRPGFEGMNKELIGTWSWARQKFNKLFRNLHLYEYS